MTIKEAADALVAALDARFLKVLAEPMRIELLKLLILHGPSNISDLAEHLPRERSVISRHLQAMLDTGLVHVEQDGRNRIYSLNAIEFINGFETILGCTRTLLTLCCPEQLPKKREP